MEFWPGRGGNCCQVESLFVDFCGPRRFLIEFFCEVWGWGSVGFGGAKVFDAFGKADAGIVVLQEFPFHVLVA